MHRNNKIGIMLIAILVALSPTVGSTAEYLYEEGIQTVEGVQIYKGLESREYYYLPSTIRLAHDDQGEPAVTLWKYNFPSQQITSVVTKLGTEDLGCQGGILALQASAELPQDKYETILKLLKNKYGPDVTLGMVPLNEATVTLEFVDPKTQSAIKIGPIVAPLDAGMMSWVLPFNVETTDILWTAMAEPSSVVPIRARFDYKFTAYVAPLKVRIKGEWENVYKHESWNTKLSGRCWFFKAKADYKEVLDSLVQDGTIEVEWNGTPTDAQAERLVDLLMGKLVEAVFDISTMIKEEPASAADPDKGWFGGVSFSKKRTKNVRKGNLFFSFTRREKLTFPDVRNSDFSELTGLAGNERHYRRVNPGEWGRIGPLVAVNADLKHYATVTVHVKYLDNAPKSVQFLADSPVMSAHVGNWAANEEIDKENRYKYQYQVEAELKNGIFPINEIPVQKFVSDWIKCDKPAITISPATWNGPQRVVLNPITFDADFEFEDIKGAAVKVVWLTYGGLEHAKTFRFRRGGETFTWETVAAFDKYPKYSVYAQFTENSGKTHGPKFIGTVDISRPSGSNINSPMEVYITKDMIATP